jgi:hypothetical protein
VCVAGPLGSRPGGISASVRGERFEGQPWEQALEFSRLSVNGLTWTTVPGIGISGLNDVAYGVGCYGIESSEYPPSLQFWTSGLECGSQSSQNFTGFSGTTIVFGNGLFVIGGTTTDGSSLIKYSRDGINWLNSRCLRLEMHWRNEVHIDILPSIARGFPISSKIQTLIPPAPPRVCSHHGHPAQYDDDPRLPRRGELRVCRDRQVGPRASRRSCGGFSSVVVV